MRQASVPSPFGTEYALSNRWTIMSRVYMSLLGVVDLPSRLRARIVLSEIRKLGWKTLLDLGCGTGCYAFYLSRKPDVTVWAVDKDKTRVSDGTLVTAKIDRKNLRFVQAADDEGLQTFNTDSLDGVLAIEVLQYVADIPKTLKEINRVLMPGGVLIGHVPLLGYLRETEQTLLNDDYLVRVIQDSGLTIVKLERTLGGLARLLCRAFDRISANFMATAICFPFLLLASFAVPVKSRDGDYRLFVCRKPITRKE